MSKLVTRKDGVIQLIGRKTKVPTVEIIKAIRKSAEKAYYLKPSSELVSLNHVTTGKWLKLGELHEKEHGFEEECTEECDKDKAAFRAFLTQFKKGQAEFTLNRMEQITLAGKETKNWMANAWQLERTQPDLFGLKSRVEHTGEGGGPIIHSVSVESRQRALAAAQKSLTIDTQQDEDGVFRPVEDE